MASGDYTIIHKAKVRSVDNGKVTVFVDLSDAATSCGGCALAASCDRENKEQKSDKVILQAEIGKNKIPEPGMTVRVGLPKGSSLAASFLLLVLPLFLFLITAITCTFAGFADWVSGLASFVIAALCYVIIVLVIRKRKTTPWVLIDIV